MNFVFVKQIDITQFTMHGGRHGANQPRTWARESDDDR